MLTLIQMIQKVQEELREPTVSSTSSTTPAKSIWKTSIITAKLNQVHDHVCARTGCLTATESQNTADDTAEYDMPTTCQNMLSIERFDGSKYTPLNFTTFQDRQIMRKDWRTESGTPTHWMNSEATGKIKITPVPGTGVTNGLFQIFQKVPSDLTADADTPFDNHNKYKSFAIVLVWGVVAQGLKEDGNEEWVDTQRDYEQGIKDLKREVENPNGQSLAFRLITTKK